MSTLAAIAGLWAGGPGSGCNPEAGHCGRPKSGLQDMLEKFSVQFGQQFSNQKHGNLWTKLAKYGHAGNTAKFSKDEQDALKRLKANVGNCRVGYCFMNAQRLALAGLDDKRVQYVEGLVTVHGVPIDHAWIEFNGKVYDPTLKPKGFEPEYFGVTVPKDEIMKHQVETKMYSPLSHYHGNDALDSKIWRSS